MSILCPFAKIWIYVFVQLQILGYNVAKTMENCNTDLSIALSRTISANNSLKNVNGFSPNQLAFGSNPNLLNKMNSKLPAHEWKTFSEIVAKNLNATHSD